MESGAPAVLPVSLEDVQKTATQKSSCGRSGCVPRSHKVHNVAILVLVFAAIACAVAPMFGLNRGWAVWHDGDFQTDESIYVTMLKAVVVDHPGEGIDPSRLDVLNRIMPKVPASVYVRQGWLETIVDIKLNEVHQISSFKQTTARSILPKNLHHKISGATETGKVSYLKPYQGERLPARFTGIFVMVVLGTSVLLGLGVLIIWGIQGIDAPVQYILRKSWIISVIMFLAIIIEYIFLAIGAHRETKMSPVFKQGHITRPDVAWILAATAATCWALIAIISRHKFMSVTYKKGPSSVASKTSWMIPVSVDKEDEVDSILNSV